MAEYEVTLRQTDKFSRSWTVQAEDKVAAIEKVKKEELNDEDPDLATWSNTLESIEYDWEVLNG